jgi:hypothetical protein
MQRKDLPMRTVALSALLVGFAVGCSPDTTEPLGATPDELDASDLRDSQSSAQRLRYTQFDITAGPATHDGWFPRGLTPQGEVIGQAFNCNEDNSVCAQDVVKRRRNGQFVVLAADFMINDVNGRGDAGGCTFNPVTSTGQAGIVRENGKLELIAPVPGEMSSCVSRVSNSGVAFVTTTDSNFVNNVYVSDRGKIRPFTVQNVSVEDINDEGQIAGIQFNIPNRAYRFDSQSQTTTILEPLSPDPQSWGFAINHRGEVLGTSFDFNGSVQRIGVWSRQNEFQTSLIATPDFIANSLSWNEQGLIVLSNTSDGNTYLVPSPGVRLDLAQLLTNPPAASGLQVIAVNRNGDIVGSAGASALLFRRD